MTLEEFLEKESIKELRIMYSHYFDGKMIEDLVDLFTDDAICEFGPNYGGDWVGKEAIHENFSRFLSGDGPTYEVMHSVTNPWIRLVDSTTDNGRWYLHDLRTSEGADNPLILYGIYDDIYKKVFVKWRIHRTRIDFLWPQREFYGLREI